VSEDLLIGFERLYYLSQQAAFPIRTPFISSYSRFILQSSFKFGQELVSSFYSVVQGVNKHTALSFEASIILLHPATSNQQQATRNHLHPSLLFIIFDMSPNTEAAESQGGGVQQPADPCIYPTLVSFTKVKADFF
jgi:hypothetical protein